jgi:hypothetical protein
MKRFLATIKRQFREKWVIGHDHGKANTQTSNEPTPEAHQTHRARIKQREIQAEHGRAASHSESVLQNCVSARIVSVL